MGRPKQWPGHPAWPKCPCSELKSANVSAFAFIESSKMRMYQLLRASRAQQCECINCFAHRELKSANVSTVSLIESSTK